MIVEYEKVGGSETSLTKTDLDDGDMYYGIGDDSDTNDIFVKFGNTMLVFTCEKNNDTTARPLSQINSKNAYPTKFVRCPPDTKIILTND